MQEGHTCKNLFNFTVSDWGAEHDAECVHSTRLRHLFPFSHTGVLPSLRGQTVHSVHCIPSCKRIPQQAQIRFVAESAKLLLFFDLLCCFGFHKKPKTLYRSKLLQK